MKIKILLPVIFVLIVLACNKDKFQTKPTISIRTINTKVVPANGTFVVDLNCTDKEGDVKDTVVIIKNRLNKTFAATVRDTIWYHLPEFPTNSKTQIELTLTYQDILSAVNPPTIPGSNPAQKQPDTLRLKFAVEDNAGNKSDTITTEPIIVIRQ